MGQLLNDLERGINIKIAASCISFIFVVVLGFVLLLRFVIKMIIYRFLKMRIYFCIDIYERM